MRTLRRHLAGRRRWDALDKSNLADKLHMVFSSTWQAEVIAEQQRELHENRIKKMLGEASYQRIRDFADWMSHYPQRSIAHAYLRQLLTGRDESD